MQCQQQYPPGSRRTQDDPKEIIGNPIILPKSYFETLKNLNNDFGAKKFLKQEDIVFVETSNATTFDIDTMCDLKKAKLHKI